jgi:hypothetical protein
MVSAMVNALATLDQRADADARAAIFEAVTAHKQTVGGAAVTAVAGTTPIPTNRAKPTPGFEPETPSLRVKGSSNCVNATAQIIGLRRLVPTGVRKSPLSQAPLGRSSSMRCVTRSPERRAPSRRLTGIEGVSRTPAPR